MKCAILASNLHLGGAERVTLNLVNGFQRHGCQTHLILVEATGELLGQVDPQVTIIDLSAGRGRRAVRAFRKYLRTECPQVVLPITYEMNIVASLAFLGLSPRPKLFLTVHNPLRRYLECSRLYRVFAMGLSRILYPRADHVISVCHGVSAELIAHKWARRDRSTAIYNPIVPKRKAALASRTLSSNVRREPTVPMIVNVGRLVPQKNQLLLLDAFKLVTDVRPAQLWIVGEGPCRGKLEERIRELGLADSVQLLGQISDPLPIIAAADAFVLSSTHEGFGNVLVEAMWAGTPIVATDCPYGPREILEGGKWGKLVPPDNAPALSEAILDLLSNGGIDARARANDFTVERAVDRYLALINSETKGHSSE